MGLLCFDLEHPVSPTYPTIVPQSFPCCPGTLIRVHDGDCEGSVTKKQVYRWNGRQYTRGGLSGAIDLLPDVVLLEIFDSYVDKAHAWQTLVHVCRKWRNVVFGSPQRLDLRLNCNAKTPVRETLDVWPPLPIVIGHIPENEGDDGLDNIIAALEHHDRVCESTLWRISNLQFEKVLAAMQRPFPALRDLQLGFEDEIDETAPVVPDLFLGGCASSLQTLYLQCIPFPGLPKLLLSATGLVELELTRIPYSGYIPPDAMATCLSALIRLESFKIGFKSPRSRPDWRKRRPPPRTRTLLPILTHLWFKGVSDYLDDFLAQIDAPLLDELCIKFFHQLVFDTPQFTQFIYRTPKFMAHELQARVNFSDSFVVITTQTFGVKLDLEISCSQTDWQLSSLAQVCSNSLWALIHAVEYLYFEDVYLLRQWQDDIESREWVELLRPFITVKDLYISEEFVPRIVPALRELTRERVTEVLPTLQTLFLDEPPPSGPVQEAIGHFVVARQLAGNPVAVSHWERQDGEDGDSYY